jgi:hypothetical protein
MRPTRFLTPAVAAVSAVFLASAPVPAQPLEGARPPITEFRGYGFIAWGLQDDIWRLKPGGGATMIYVLRRGYGGPCTSSIEGADEGTWSMRGGQICVEWRVRRDISGCYAIHRRSGIHVRLVGPVTYEGTIE